MNRSLDGRTLHYHTTTTIVHQQRHIGSVLRMPDFYWLRLALETFLFNCVTIRPALGTEIVLIVNNGEKNYMANWKFYQVTSENLSDFEVGSTVLWPATVASYHSAHDTLQTETQNSTTEQDDIQNQLLQSNNNTQLVACRMSVKTYQILKIVLPELEFKRELSMIFCQHSCSCHGHLDGQPAWWSCFKKLFIDSLVTLQIQIV